ncbi:outer membrane lipoprotein OprI [Pseudomonas alloputida]|uniref:outer membrane lipoprotein OprI n=1 Tax=Pseudomonas TaxID=286 RepID=UPI003EEB286F
MQRYLLLGWASLLLVSASGCSPWRTAEYDARLESAENNAATARLRADQVCYRIDLVEQTANEALRRATQAEDQVQQLKLQQARRK